MSSEILSAWIGCSVERGAGLEPITLPLRRVVSERGALDALPEVVATEVAPDASTLLVADPDTWDAAGARAAASLRSAGHVVHETMTTREPHADDATIDALVPHLDARPDVVVAVGAGTISDLGKVLAERAEIPQITVGTAASMNGYASSIAALTIKGLKITRPAPCPVALVLDADVVAAAPPRLTGAGFGDLMSKPVSGADWVLSGWLFDAPVVRAALEMADGAVARARSVAAAIGRAEPDAVAALTDALVLSGLSMCVAGASSPASGGEHLFSHYLDISADGWGRPPRLHGEQVTIGTLLSLRLYEAVRAAGLPDTASKAPPEEDDATLRALHAHLDAAALDELLDEARAKRALTPDRSARRARVAKRWDEMWSLLDDQLRAGEGLIEDLRAAGAPIRFEDIDVTPERAAQVIRRARHMRRRFTVLDLAADLDVLGGFAEDVSRC